MQLSGENFYFWLFNPLSKKHRITKKGNEQNTLPFIRGICFMFKLQIQTLYCKI